MDKETEKEFDREFVRNQMNDNIHSSARPIKSFISAHFTDKRTLKAKKKKYPHKFADNSIPLCEVEDGEMCTKCMEVLFYNRVIDDILK